MSGFETHRCDKRPEGSGIRKYERDPQRRHQWPKPNAWILCTLDYDYEWDSYYYRQVCDVSFCPWCGKELVSE